MNWLTVTTAALWVELFFMFVHKFLFHMTNSLSVWWSPVHGMTAVTSDVLVLVLGIYLAKFFLPTWNLLASAVTVQVIHDILLYFIVILGVPTGQNVIIDLFKKYSAEGSWKIIVADSVMIGSTVLGMNYLETLKTDTVIFVGLLAIYALTYLIYTKSN